MIKLNNLCVSYKGREVIHHLDEEIGDELTIIIGLNGCGKSTLMKSMAGIHNEYSGSIAYDGKDINEMTLNKKARLIAYMPQIRQLPSITVSQYVIHGRYPYISESRRYSKEDYEMTSRLLNKLGIYNLRNNILKSLSGGERQKAYLAMALVQDTEYILLDEPGTFLDMHCQYELMNILEELKNEGKKIIMIQHDIQMALKYADKIIVLRDGRRICTGNPDFIAQSGIIESTFGVSIEKLNSYTSSMYVVLDSGGKYKV